MLTPYQLQHIGDTMIPIMDDLQAWIVKDMVQRLMLRMGRGEKQLLTGTDEWQTRVYQESGGLFEDLQDELAKFLRLSRTEVAQIFLAAGIKSLAADSRVFVAAGQEAVGLSDHMARLLAAEYERTMGDITNFTRTTASAAQIAFRDVLNDAHMKVLTGAQSYTAAVREAVEGLSANQTRVQYPTGHSDTIETAVLRAVRTGTAQATGNMTIQGLKDRDYDLIRVSAHIGARYGDGGQNPGNHAWWQGKLYSRTGKTAGYPLFEEATGYGTGEGLCGWNCRHSFGPGDPNHNPYKDYDSEENKKAYDLSQKQRQLERAIRKTKREIIGLQSAISASGDEDLTAELTADYTAKAVKLRNQNAAYNMFCQQNGLPKLDDRIRVAQWDRSTAAKASAAARKALG